MAEQRRVVAELGRPETPEETAARKAEASRVYRSSQNTRNLIAALLVTLAVVAVIVFAVPRGTPPEREPIDVAAEAQRVASAEQRTVLAPEVPDSWLVNRAAIQGEDSVRAWTIVYAPPGDGARFLRIAQGFDADDNWPTRLLSGSAPDDTITIDGIRWESYRLDAGRTGNVSVALATRAGADTVVIYGVADAQTLEVAAEAVSDQITTLREEAE
jgi:hypothetical protein